ncbi:MAG: DegV family protein [Lachnospiraceae bacterium]|nr:DegV family protein [Lachnospiraceae bacterium]
MKKIGIVTDSHSGITQKEAEKLGIIVLPMPFYLGEECFYEEVTVSRREFLERLRLGAPVSTSQPAPAAVLEVWDRALLEYEQIVYIPISSGLSGSCATAMSLAEEKAYKGRVWVVDNGRVSTLLHRAVLDALELVQEGYGAEQIKEILEAYRDKMTIYVAVDTLENLRRGGRISGAAASFGTLLNIKPILKFDVGTLDAYMKCRGFKRARREMLEAMRREFETTFREAYEEGEIYLLAATSADEETTRDWIREIEEFFPGMPVLCDDLSLGVACHIGAGGLGIGCSVRPKRPERK